MSEQITTIGRLIDETAKRDAIHLAIAPVIAGENLKPGEEVGFITSSTEVVGAFGTPIGIVDPFLKEMVKKGQRFWMFLFPNTITSLRHEWTHPAFGAVVAVDKSASEAWLREFAEENEIDYGELIEGAVSGDGACFGDDGGPEEARTDEFWRHIEEVTGKTFSSKHRDNTYFRCAC